MAMKEKFKNLLQLSMLQAAEIKEIKAGDMAELQKSIWQGFQGSQSFSERVGKFAYDYEHS